ARASGVREIARAGFHAGASWAQLPRCPIAPACPACPSYPACYCTCGEGFSESGLPGGGGGRGGPSWVAGAVDAQCDALAGALREAAEGCVGWTAAASLAVLAQLVGYGFGRLVTQVQDAQGRPWHERILLYPATSEAAESGGRGACWVVLSPGMDMYVEELEGGSFDDGPVEWLEVPRDLRLPAGFGRAYRFDASPSDADMRGLFRRACAAALADAESRRMALDPSSTIGNSLGRDVAVEDAPGANFFGGRRLVGKRPPTGAGAGAVGGVGEPLAHAGEAAEGAGGGAAAVGGTAAPRSSGLAWRAAESDERSRIVVDDELGSPAHERRGKGLFHAGPGRGVVVHLAGLDQASRLAPQGRRGGVAALAAKSGARGRGREWREVAGACEEKLFGDFPVRGPRSARWCLDILRRRRASTDSHLVLETTARPQSEQRGVQEHEQLMKYTELAGTCGQLDSSNCALAEADSASSKDKMSPQEYSAFSGFSAAGDLLMVAPARLEFAEGQVEKDAAIMENIRK
ncbi:unnamed protein product, partial [Prorocentrum cordatum]